jgi:hypothetical protein
MRHEFFYSTVGVLRLSGANHPRAWAFLVGAKATTKELREDGSGERTSICLVARPRVSLQQGENQNRRATSLLINRAIERQRQRYVGKLTACRRAARCGATAMHMRKDEISSSTIDIL